MGLFSVSPAISAYASGEYDTADPLFLVRSNDMLSETGINFMDDIIRISQKVSYGLNNRLVLNADMNYQEDLNGREDGFSNFRLGGIYRMSSGSNIISDALFGIKFSGSSRVHDPEYSDTVYHAGVRMGRQWSRFTLAGTLKTSWIFDEHRGMAFINFVPEAYLRITDNWMTGFGFDFRKSTDPRFDQEWMNFQLVRRYGRTQYIGTMGYEFESAKYQAGVRVNILF